MVYKTAANEMPSGLLGLATWCLCPDGEKRNFQSYGHGPNGDECIRLAPPDHRSTLQDLSVYEEAARKAYGFWNHSATHGESDYLKRKSVGSYGIRFRHDEKYGKVAVVPMYDIDGRLWSYQLLNTDGGKHNAKGGCVSGLSHFLPPVGGLIYQNRQFLIGRKAEVSILPPHKMIYNVTANLKLPVWAK